MKNQFHKKVVLIVQARMGSTRLPGKSIFDLSGQSLIYRVLERIKRSNQIDELVLAIPENPEDDILVKEAQKSKVKIFRGSENDLLDRYYKAAKSTGADIVARIPADNPLSEPHEIDKIISHHRSLKKPGFSSNLAQVNGNGYPDGIGAEVFDFQLLENAWMNEDDKNKREHVHLNFYDYESDKSVDESLCPVTTIECPEKYRRPDIILDVNTKQQYEFIKEIYDFFFESNPYFGIKDIIDWYDNIYLKNS
jgi:spore coat polysaccharide biosynthesis protein SpsF